MQLNQLGQLANLSGGNKLPTEYSFKEALAIYLGRVAILIAGSILAALVLVSTTLAIHTPYRLSITFAATVLAGLTALTYTRKAAIRLPQVRKATLEEYQDVTEEAASKPGGSLRRAEATIVADLEVVSSHLKRLKNEEDAIRELFNHDLERGDYTFPSVSVPFAISEETKIAKASFLAAFASVVLGSALSTIILTRVFGRSILVLLLGPAVEILLMLVVQACFALTFAGGSSPRTGLMRMRRFILFPSILLFLLCVIVTTVLRTAGAGNSLWLFEAALAGASILLPIIAGAFLLIGQIMSWSKTTQSKYKALEKQEARLNEMQIQLQGKLYVLTDLQEQSKLSENRLMNTQTN
ncbi:MAG TPA: hypothetical protein VGO56_15515 [Pyrinomonadaceae bacterium]|jgi:hypothetical protein|nr:hypothetical protein [Pyrinomonadaceae bacterium]